MSNLGSINLRDLAKSLAMVILSAILATLYPAVQAFLSGGAFVVNWGEVLKIGLSAGLAYIAKQYFTDSSGKLFGHI